MKYPIGEKLAKRMEEMIPGGSHALSKGRDLFPAVSPKVISRAKGAYCWDVDENCFIDWGMANQTVILGHADPVVNQAVKEAIDRGSNFTRPGLLEYQLAEFLLGVWPRMDMVKFAKSSSDVTTAAVKLARAATGRKYVAVCDDQTTFSVHDWFIGTTRANSGVPEEGYRHTLKFKYNDLPSLQQLIDQYGGQIAAVILEPVKRDEPRDNFLGQLRALTSKHGIVLIFDETISGMRFGLAGAHELYGVYPDLACYGRAISNGYSCAVLAGKRDLMELGGLNHDKPRVFLLSQTHGSETTGLAATLATMQEYQRRGLRTKIFDIGVRLKKSIREVSQLCGTLDFVRVVGFEQNPLISCTRADGTAWPLLQTLFHQYVIESGILIPSISITDSHRESEITTTLDAIKLACARISKLLGDEKMLRESLVGPTVKPVFRKFNSE